MQLYAHASTALPFAYLVLIEYGVSESSLVLVGVLFPDFMDAVLAKSSGVEFFSLHRTISHWPAAYTPFLFWIDYGCFFLIGVGLHLLFDFCTPMGIPLLPAFFKRWKLSLTYRFRKRSSLNLFKNKSVVEKIIAASFTLAFFAVFITDGAFVDLNEFKKIISNVIYVWY